MVEADCCFPCQICNMLLRATGRLSPGPRCSGRGSPKPGEFETSCFGVPLARTGAVARHLQTLGSHLLIDTGRRVGGKLLLAFQCCMSAYLILNCALKRVPLAEMHNVSCKKSLNFNQNGKKNILKLIDFFEVQNGFVLLASCIHSFNFTNCNNIARNSVCQDFGSKIEIK